MEGEEVGPVELASLSLLCPWRARTRRSYSNNLSMGLTSSSHRRRRLRPAAEVTETPYEVKSIECVERLGKGGEREQKGH